MSDDTRDREAHGGEGAERRGSSGDAQAGDGSPPGIGGYEDRDPATEMPRMPSAPAESQDPDED